MPQFYSEDVAALSKLNPVPQEFAVAQSVLRAIPSTRHVSISEISPPQRLAPHAVALSAEVCGTDSPTPVTQTRKGELATGRIVVLYDPHSPAEWEGQFRVVSYVRAELEAELGHEILLGSVAWSWLTEALESNACDHAALGGTTTRVLSESFGSLAAKPSTVDLELRASWTPHFSKADAIGNHVQAWVDLLCAMGGLPPLPEDVIALPGAFR